jgi:hypothetical protein
MNVYEPPTIEQLANFACVRIFGPGGVGERSVVLAVLEASPAVRERWLTMHREFQEEAWAIAGAEQPGGPDAR